MNYRQKLGYMALGAGVLAIGITIGQWITPNIEAQNNGVFDEIICRSLKVVSGLGNRAILLNSGKEGNAVVVYDTTGEKAIGLVSVINDTPDLNRNAVLPIEKHDNMLMIYNRQDQQVISLLSSEEQNYISLLDPQGRKAIYLPADSHNNAITLFDKANNIQWFKMAH